MIDQDFVKNCRYVFGRHLFESEASNTLIGSREANAVSTTVQEGSTPMSGRAIRLGVVGTGYVGLTTGACFAHIGHHVVCGDIDQRKVDLLNDGQIPIVEDGLEQIVLDARSEGRLEFVFGAAA
ncbi:MAG: threonine dehydrogenase-like Zn-dependent dehydrogenase, partial [Minisyncoccia bacterium]